MNLGGHSPQPQPTWRNTTSVDGRSHRVWPWPQPWPKQYSRGPVLRTAAQRSCLHPQHKNGIRMLEHGLRGTLWLSDTTRVSQGWVKKLSKISQEHKCWDIVSRICTLNYRQYPEHKGQVSGVNKHQQTPQWLSSMALRRASAATASNNELCLTEQVADAHTRSAKCWEGFEGMRCCAATALERNTWGCSWDYLWDLMSTIKYIHYNPQYKIISPRIVLRFKKNQQLAMLAMLAMM